MIKITIRNIDTLKKDDLILYDGFEWLRFTGRTSVNIWEFVEDIAEDECLMDGTLPASGQRFLTKSELLNHAYIID